MSDPAHQMLWRESLRKPKKSYPAQSKTCKKLARHSVRETITAALEKRLSPLKQSPRSSLPSSQSKQESLKDNYSKLENFHKEILHHYKEVITKQQQNLSQISFENQILEKKIERMQNLNCPNISVELEADEKIVNYYKSSIKTAENLLIQMKNEFSAKYSALVQEKNQLEAEISFKEIKLID
jgi:hypothetical protein